MTTIQTTSIKIPGHVLIAYDVCVWMGKLRDALQQSGIVWERDYATNVNLEQKFGILSLGTVSTVLACSNVRCADNYQRGAAFREH